MTSVISSENLRIAIRLHANPHHAKILQRFFKAGPGEYGEGEFHCLSQEYPLYKQLGPGRPFGTSDYQLSSQETRDRSILRKLARSKSVWERRIGIMATFCFIKEGDFSDALSISEMLIDDMHDLIHKAVGWMLREVGKRNMAAEEGFLQSHYETMPRTMLRYAIERFPEKKRQGYLKGLI